MANQEPSNTRSQPPSPHSSDVPTRSSWRGYGAAVLAVAAVVTVRLLLAPLVGMSAPYILFVVAAAFAAAVGGLRAAALAVALSALAALFFFVEPIYSIRILNLSDGVNLLLFVAVAALVAWLVDRVKRERARAVSEAEAARLQREHLRVTLSSIGDAVIATDAAGAVEFLNPTAETLTGWPLKEATGRPLEDVFRIVHEVTRAPVEQPVRRALVTGKVTGLANHTLLIARDGTERAIDDNAAPIRDSTGKVAGCVLVFRDVTSSRLAEAALEASEEEFRTSFELSAVGQAQTDPATGRILRVNQRLCEITGYTAEELLRTTLSDITHPDDRTEFERTVRGEQPSLSLEKRYVTKAGGEVWVRVTEAVIRDAQGRPQRTAAIIEDVTDRRRAEQELRQKEAELTDFIENATVGLHWVGPDGTILWANRAELELLGYAREEYVGRNIADFHADSPVIADILCRLTSGEELHGYEARLRCKDGSIRHVLISSSVYRKDGAFHHTRCFTRDITERKRAEDRQRFLADVAVATQPLTDPDEITAATARVLGEQLGVDRCAYAEVESDQDHFNLTGDYCRGVPSIVGRYSLSDFGDECLRLHLAGKPYIVHDVEKDTRVTSANLAAYRQTQIAAVISVPLHKAGRFVAGMAVHHKEPRHWTEGEVELLELAAARCWESIERARALKSLRESEERFRAMADSAPVLIWMNGTAGAEFVNREYLKFLGRTWEEVQQMEWTTNLHPDDAEGYVRAYLRAFEGRERFEAQFRFRRHDGEFRWFQSAGVPRFGPDGAFLGYVGCSFDVTDIKRAEEALREAGRRKDEFLALFAHELRNPLAPIRNAVQILGVRTDAVTVERARQMIDRQVRQLVHIVDDLLEVSRLARGKVSLREERLDMALLARTVAQDMRPGFEAAHIELTVSTPETPAWVLGDDTRLTQILSNLLTNAQKFTGADGEVTVAVAAEADDVILTVKDTGAGIPTELLPRLFEPFAQADQGLARSAGGLGLGLAIVKGLVELHRGSVAAESEGPGAGAAFTVRLPGVEEPRAVNTTSPPPARVAAPAERRLRVLVIEDNRDSADSLRMLLELCACHVTVAYNGPEGLRAAETGGYDLVLCDIGLPGMSGYEIARRLNASRGSKEPVLVALTGYGREEDREAAKAAGFDQHFVKPLEPGVLERLLAGVH